MLNYFNTTGKDWVARRATPARSSTTAPADPVGDNDCSDNGPRGAAESSGGTDLTDPKADLERQRVKEVRAINTMNADIMSLEEIENSAALGESDRDDALKSLVDALNADAGTTRWAYAPSPDAADLPPIGAAGRHPHGVHLQPEHRAAGRAVEGAGRPVRPGQPFANAREPLAQEFKRKGALDSDGFLVVVNHLKSKGDSSPPATGDNANGIQGAFNGDRVRQAHALVDFAKATAQADGTKKIFLVGDFNSYTQEDPMQVLYQNGFVNQPSDDPRTRRTSSTGMAGSLDHVLANAAAANLVTGRDVWQINAEESVGFEYSRYNYNATLLYQPNQFRASDHNPELVGLDVAVQPAGLDGHRDRDPDRVQKKKTRVAHRRHRHRCPGRHPDRERRDLGGRRRRSRTATLSDGTGQRVGRAVPERRDRHVEVRYLGDDVTKPGTATTDVTVTNGKPVASRSRRQPAAVAAAREGRLDQRQVAEGLREVADHPAVARRRTPRTAGRRRWSGRRGGRRARARRRAARRAAYAETSQNEQARNGCSSPASPSTPVWVR